MIRCSCPACAVRSCGGYQGATEDHGGEVRRGHGRVGGNACHAVMMTHEDLLPTLPCLLALVPREGPRTKSPKNFTRWGGIHMRVGRDWWAVGQDLRMCPISPLAAPVANLCPIGRGSPGREARVINVLGGAGDGGIPRERILARSCTRRESAWARGGPAFWCLMLRLAAPELELPEFKKLVYSIYLFPTSNLVPV